MEALLDAITTIARSLSHEKIQSIASRLMQLDTEIKGNALNDLIGTPLASKMVDELIQAWRNSPISPNEIALMLLAASNTFTTTFNEQKTELVWTGPTTPFVAARRTEQALLQVINAAQTELFITSFVAYNIPSVVNALNAAHARGVNISILLESSQNHGGSINIDVIGKMRSMVPGVSLYAWIDKSGDFSDGCVHAKLAVADGKLCFITSANLTGHAMDKNIEAGVLISGGNIPKQILTHLNSLIYMKALASV